MMQIRNNTAHTLRKVLNVVFAFLSSKSITECFYQKYELFTLFI